MQERRSRLCPLRARPRPARPCEARPRRAVARKRGCRRSRGEPPTAEPPARARVCAALLARRSGRGAGGARVQLAVPDARARRGVQPGACACAGLGPPAPRTRRRHTPSRSSMTGGSAARGGGSSDARRTGVRGGPPRDGMEHPRCVHADAKSALPSKGTDYASTSTNNASKGTDNASKGTDNASKEAGSGTAHRMQRGSSAAHGNGGACVGVGVCAPVRWDSRHFLTDVRFHLCWPPLAPPSRFSIAVHAAVQRGRLRHHAHADAGSPQLSLLQPARRVGGWEPKSRLLWCR